MQFLISILLRIKEIALTPISIRDLIYFIGLGLMSYGIYLKIPWLSYITCGVILMFTAYLTGDS